MRFIYLENNKHYCDSMNERMIAYERDEYRKLEADEKFYFRRGVLYTVFSGVYAVVGALGNYGFFGKGQFTPLDLGWSVAGTIVTFAVAARYFMKEATATLKGAMRPK